MEQKVQEKIMLGCVRGILKTHTNTKKKKGVDLMWSRWKSPVVWAAVLAVALAQWNLLATMETIGFWEIGSVVLTLAVSFVAALNNPTEKNKF